MYAMTAAHKTLPLPSYARVRNPANGREAIVRINDRGPFVDGRVIDLSYAAAARLGYLGGVAPVEIERITNEDIRTGAWRRDAAVQLASAGSAPAAVPLARSGASASPAGRAVAVPAAWTVPAAAGGADLAVSQATPQPVAANTADPASTAPAEPPSSRTSRPRHCRRSPHSRRYRRPQAAAAGPKRRQRRRRPRPAASGFSWVRSGRATARWPCRSASSATRRGRSAGCRCTKTAGCTGCSRARMRRGQTRRRRRRGGACNWADRRLWCSAPEGKGALRAAIRRPGSRRSSPAPPSFPCGSG